MSELVSFTVLGLVTASVYAIAASGLVVTYTTTGIFNFAHGAIGMLGAFAFWQLHVEWGLPWPVAVVAVVGVAAPVLGLGIERGLVRGLGSAPEVARVVVPVGLLLGIVAVAPLLFPPVRTRVVPPFMGGGRHELAGVAVTGHQLAVMATAVIVGVGLWWLLDRTRTGSAMRAVVADPQLAELHGVRPDRQAGAAWALGCGLAALAGILVADQVGLEVLTLTLLVVNAYAAAVVGRLSSLPLTYLGAVVLGLAQAYAVGYMPADPSWLPDGFDLVGPLRLAMPVILLFAVLVILPQGPLASGGLERGRGVIPRPSARQCATGVAVLLVTAVGVSVLVGDSAVPTWGRGLAYGVIMLSLVPLVGYAGQISLAQLSFAGLGAWVVARWGVEWGFLALPAAALAAACAGALVALPAMRVRGIYLALATFAFATFADRVVFSQDAFFGGGALRVHRPTLGPISFDSDRAYLLLAAVAFALCALVVTALRRGRMGRRLIALADSPAACATLGVGGTGPTLGVFVLSAGIAGLGGALLAGVTRTAGPSQFDALAGLPVLLVAVVAGVAMVSGALVGGIVFAVLLATTGGGELVLLAPAVAGMVLGRYPNGVTYALSTWGRSLADSAAGFRREPAEEDSGGLPVGR